MAKRKLKSINRHVPTDLGIAILSMVLLLGIAFFLVAYNQPLNTSDTQTLGATTHRPTPTSIKHPTPTPIRHKPTPSPIRIPTGTRQ